MTGWLGRQRTWLGKKKPAPASAPVAAVPEADMATVRYHAIRCPGCGSKRVLVYKTASKGDNSSPTVRYHKCEDCKLCFKSVEDPG